MESVNTFEFEELFSWRVMVSVNMVCLQYCPESLTAGQPTKRSLFYHCHVYVSRKGCLVSVSITCLNDGSDSDKRSRVFTDNSMDLLDNEGPLNMCVFRNLETYGT